MILQSSKLMQQFSEKLPNYRVLLTEDCSLNAYRCVNVRFYVLFKKRSCMTPPEDGFFEAKTYVGVIQMF
jgi:hypothetical protein